MRYPGYAQLLSGMVLTRVLVAGSKKEPEISFPGFSNTVDLFFTVSRGIFLINDPCIAEDAHETVKNLFYPCNKSCQYPDICSIH